MTEYTSEEIRHARQVLGLREDGEFLPIQQRDREALLVTIELMQIQAESQRAAHKAQEEFMQKRLKSAWAARRLANRRADDAVAAMKTLIDTFSKWNTTEEKP